MSRQPEPGDPRTPAVCGLHLGDSSSRLTLAYLEDDAEDKATIIRVHGRNDDSSGFSSYATIRDGQLRPGPRVLDESDESWPLMAAFLHRICVIRRRTRELSAGPELLDAFDSGVLTAKKVDDAMIEHLTCLKDAATAQAGEAGLEIRVLNVGHPNFFSKDEGKDSFRRFKDQITRLLRRVFGAELRIRFSNKGQAIAAYLSEQFSDPDRPRQLRSLHRQFRSVGRDGGIALAVVHCGSSTLNYQVQTQHFDEDGSFLYGQSSVGPDWSPGVPGGSQVADDVLRNLLRERLGGDVAPREIAHLMRQVRERRSTLNYMVNEEPIVLTRPGGSSITLEAREFKLAFERGLRDVLKVLRTELRRLVDLGLDFAALFCGSSFVMPGAQYQVEAYMTGLRAVADEKGVRCRHAFLHDFDAKWYSAVETGAAVAMLRMPTPAQVFRGSAIGIQVLEKRQSSDLHWGGTNEAKVLLRAACGEPLAAEYTVGPLVRTRMMFSLVCDPTYDSGPAGQAGSGRHPDIPIGPPAQVLAQASLAPYDLDWTVEASELPPGRVRVCFEGEDAALVAAGSLEAFGSRPIRLVLAFYQIDDHGNQLRSPGDRRWKLNLRTDPMSKFLLVGEDDKELPVWCKFCAARLSRKAYTCTTCENLSACEDCYNMEVVPDGHHERHLFLVHRCPR